MQADLCTGGFDRVPRCRVALPPSVGAGAAASVLLLALTTTLAARDATAAIVAWQSPDSIHLSNVGAPDDGEDFEVLADDVVAAPPAAIAVDVPDLRRLVARDPLTAERLRAFGPMVTEAARAHGVDAALLLAVVAVESAYNPSARSNRGAVGLMQLLPATAARFGVHDLEDPRENLKAGCLYLRELLQFFHENIVLAVAAYNAGQGAVLRSGGRIPPYPETVRYVPQVLEIYRGLQR